MTPTLIYAPEVQAAKDAGRPLVALESTIITHGMPFPANLETALKVEAAVRNGGAVPATIAILGGRPTVGLSIEQIEHLASLGPMGVAKASRRDIGVLVARRVDGATTVAGTMVVAALAGT